MILDLAAIAIVVVMCIIGVRRGILKMLMHMCSWALSMVLAWFLYTPVADFIKSTVFAENIRELVRTGFVEPRMSGAESMVPELFRGMFEAGMDSGAAAISAGIADIIISVMAFVLTLLLCRAVLLLLSSVCNLASKLPVIKQCNKLLGGVLGIVEGILILYIAAALIFAFAPLHESEFFEEQLSQSQIAAHIYGNNFITHFPDNTGKTFQ